VINIDLRNWCNHSKWCSVYLQYIMELDLRTSFSWKRIWRFSNSNIHGYINKSALLAYYTIKM